MGKTLRWLLLAAVSAVLLVWFTMGGGPRIQPGSLLVLEIGGAYVETGSTSFVARLMGDGPRPLISLLSQLAKAERDDRLDTVVLEIRPLEIGWGKAQEIRDAIARVGDEGRRTIAYLEVEKFGANIEYYVASAADEVYMAPGSRNPFVGLAAEYLFLGGFFEKLGVDLEYERIGRYKSAVESFAERRMSEPNREMANALLDSLDSRLVNDIASARDIPPDRVREIIDNAPTSPAEMQKAGLIDGVDFVEALIDRAEERVVRADVYAQVDPESLGFDPEARVALIYGAGPVVTGKGSVSRGGDPVLAARTVAKAIRDAADDPDVAGILFRIDSPGGSALASDLVWSATQEARAKGKPFVVSMADVAASGGYYVACGADHVIAQPSTFTGSIGVFVLRPVLGDLLEKLDVGVETLTRGAHADLLLASRPLSARTRSRLRADVKGVYDLFVSRVADGRELAVAAVDEIGRGRVWTGDQALAIGLVDELGGIRTAVLALKDSLGLDPDADVALVPFPPARPIGEQIRDLLNTSIANAVRDTLGIGPALDGLRSVAGLETHTPLLIPPLIPRIR